MDEVNAVNVDATPESAPESAQPTVGSEPVQTPEGTVSREVYENVVSALRKEREEKKRLKTQLATPVQSEPNLNQDDPIVQDYLRTKADAYIARKVATDPGFKDLIPEIEAKMTEKGLTIDQAEKEVKADILDRILREGTVKVEEPKPKQLTPTAVPEPEQRKTTGNVIDDILQGNVEVKDPAILETLRRLRQK